MKRLTGMIGAAVLAFALVGCATTGTTRQPEKENWIFTEAGLEADQSPAMTIVVKDAPEAPTEFRPETGTYGKIYWLFAMLERLDLKEKLNLDAKEELYRALFTRLPLKPSDGFFRAVAVAGYFDGGKPLILYAQAFPPSSKAPATWSLVLQYTGNFVVTTDKATGVTKRSILKAFVAPNFNWYTNGLILADGLVVRGNSLYSKSAEDEIRKDAGDDVSLANANLSDIYINDELAENDAIVEPLLAQVMADPKATAETKTLAQLNLATFFLAHDKPTQAAEALERSVQEGKTVTEPSLRRVIDVDAPEILALYQRVTR